MKIVSVVGARPNFMKIAPLIKEMRKKRRITNILVHTGQHYDRSMSHAFFVDLGIPRPDVNFDIGSGSHSEQTAKIMLKFEKLLLKEKPDLVMVVGDVNSTLACTLVAAKLRIATAHVEAGLRSFDRTMPEEINRLVTDSVADILFTTSRDANQNLSNEGIPKDRIFFVGNVMIDTLLDNLHKSKKSDILNRMMLQKKKFALVTLHRPSNVDAKSPLINILSALYKIQKKIKIIFPVHPRTLKNIKKFISQTAIRKMDHLVFLEPQGYFDFLNLMANAKFVITDSGGIQEETTILGVPCLTIRQNTERPVTITEGTNTLVGMDSKRIVHESLRILKGHNKKGKRPRYWDGQASRRIVEKLLTLHRQKKLLRCGHY